LRAGTGADVYRVGRSWVVVLPCAPLLALGESGGEVFFFVSGERVGGEGVEWRGGVFGIGFGFSFGRMWNFVFVVVVGGGSGGGVF